MVKSWVRQTDSDGLTVLSSALSGLFFLFILRCAEVSYSSSSYYYYDCFLAVFAFNLISNKNVKNTFWRLLSATFLVRSAVCENMPFFCCCLFFPIVQMYHLFVEGRGVFSC